MATEREETTTQTEKEEGKRGLQMASPGSFAQSLLPEGSGMTTPASGGREIEGGRARNAMGRGRDFSIGEAAGDGGTTMEAHQWWIPVCDGVVEEGNGEVREWRGMGEGGSGERERQMQEGGEMRAKVTELLTGPRDTHVRRDEFREIFVKSPRG